MRVSKQYNMLQYLKYVVIHIKSVIWGSLIPKGMSTFEKKQLPIRFHPHWEMTALWTGSFVETIIEAVAHHAAAAVVVVGCH